MPVEGCGLIADGFRGGWRESWTNGGILEGSERKQPHSLVGEMGLFEMGANRLSYPSVADSVLSMLLCSPECFPYRTPLTC